MVVHGQIIVDAVDISPLTLFPAEVTLGTDADAWFMALDGQVVRVGDDTAILRVEGIHGEGSTLWIQVSLFEDGAPGVVLRVDASQGRQDVFDTLRHYELTGIPLEIINVRGRV
jgi:hypothetical protein